MKAILQMEFDGDILIFNAHTCVCVYHKSYNPGEDLQENLKEAYKEWEKLNEND